jgi:hypothetical protein
MRSRHARAISWTDRLARPAKCLPGDPCVRSSEHEQRLKGPSPVGGQTVAMSCRRLPILAEPPVTGAARTAPLGRATLPAAAGRGVAGGDGAKR